MVGPPSPTKNIRVLMVGSYDYLMYARGRIMYKGLRRVGAHVSLALNRGFGRLAHLVSRLLKLDYDAIIVTGKPELLITWLFKPLHRKPIVFDVFISDYETLVIDRKTVKKNSLTATLLWWADKISCHLADEVIHDTEENVNYFAQTFDVDKSKFSAVPVGSDDDIFKPAHTPHKGFIVMFYGTYIPVQGIEHIVNAAKLLEGYKDIRFELVGRGQTRAKIEQLVSQLDVTNITFHDMMPVEKLAKELGRADVLLGIFATMEKALRSIPNKAYDAIAMQKPLITAESYVTRRTFRNNKDALLVPPGDPEAIAHAILTLYKNRALRQKIGVNGYQLFKKNFSPQYIGKLLMSILRQSLTCKCLG